MTKKGKSEDSFVAIPIITTASERLDETEQKLHIPEMVVTKAIKNWQDDKLVDIKANDAQLEIVGSTGSELAHTMKESAHISVMIDSPEEERSNNGNMNSVVIEHIHDEITCEMRNFIESDLDELSIDEVLMAFRNDAVAAEKAILMATTRGHLHPREFREYLKAFKSPTKSIPEIQMDTTFSRTQTTMTKENNLAPTYYPRIDNTIASSSPKSSLLNMLSLADTPQSVKRTTGDDTDSLYSPVTSCQDLPFKDSKAKIQEESKQSLKDRTEAMRLVVAAAVASVTTLTTLTSSSSVVMSAPPIPSSSSSSTVPMKNISLEMKSLIQSAIKSPLSIPVEIPILESGNEEEGFLPSKRLIHTPPKEIAVEGYDTFPMSISQPIEAEKSLSKEPLVGKQDVDFVNMEGTEISCIKNQLVALGGNDDRVTEVSLDNRIVDSQSSIEPKYLTFDKMEADPDHESSLPEDLSMLLASAGHGHDDIPSDWSHSELDRVSGVIRRVSKGADNPYIQSIVKQLQLELAKLKGEVINQNSLLEVVAAERAEVEQRLLEVESKVLTASLEAEQQSTARIEAEIQAARECVERLADHKEILKQRRCVREERLLRMDAEVAAEVANMNARKMARARGAGAVNRQLLAADQQGTFMDIYIHVNLYM